MSHRSAASPLGPALVALLLAGGGLRPAVAQVAADTVELEPLTVSATRVPVAANAVTASVAVITGDELRARGVVFVADALRELPSATVVQGGGYGGIGALFLRGGESDYVKVLVDGVPLNDAGGAFNFANLTTANLDRIEVVRGPVSVLYGSEAVTGLIQIFTRGGGGPARLTAAVEGGTDATSHWDVAASGGTRWGGWSVGLSRFASDGMYEFNSDYRNTGVSARVTAVPGPATDLAATARYSDARAAFPTDFAGVPSDSNQFGTHRQLALGLESGHRLSALAEARVTASFARTETGADDQPDGPSDASGFGFRSERRALGHRGSVDARVNLRPGPHLVTSIGAQYERETEETASETESDFGEGPFVERSEFEARRRTLAVYAQVVAEPTARLALTANGRVDENSAFGALGTVRGGAAYRFGTGTRIRGSLGTAYKAPTFCEQFCNQPFIVGDPSLTPEQVTAWEIGAEQTLAAGRVTLAATWFDQRFRDRIEYISAAPDDPNYVNLTAARASGLEIAVGAVPAAGLRLSAAYTWLDTEVTDDGGDPTFTEGAPLLRRPEHALSLNATWAVAGRGTVYLGVVRVGARDDYDFAAGGQHELPAYSLVEAAVAADVTRASSGTPSLTLTLRVENLFDDDYLQTFGFPGRGRMVFAGVRTGL